MKFFRNPFEGNRVTKNESFISLEGFPYPVPQDKVGTIEVLKQGTQIGGWTPADTNELNQILADITREYEKTGADIPDDYETKLRAYLASHDE